MSTIPRLLVSLPHGHAPVEVEGYDTLVVKDLEAVRLLATGPSAIVTHDETLAAYAFLVASARRLDSALPHDPLPPPIIPALGPAAPLLRLIAITSPSTALTAARAISITPAFSSPTTAAQAIVVMLAATMHLSQELQQKLYAHAPLADDEKVQVNSLYEAALIVAGGSSTLTHAVTVSRIQTKIAIRLARATNHLSNVDALAMVRAHYPTESLALWIRIAASMGIETPPDLSPGVIEIPLTTLRVDDCLATDLVNAAGHLVAKRGYRITAQFLSHRAAQDYGSLPDMIIVQRTS